jgi:hypothetical protein
LVRLTIISWIPAYLPRRGKLTPSWLHCSDVVHLFISGLPFEIISLALLLFTYERLFYVHS